MFNIIKLDWSVMKCYHIRILLIFVGLLIIGYISPIALVPTSVFLLFCFSINPFAIEEKGDLNRLYLTLPIKRDTIVAGRYILAFLLYLIGVLFSLILMPFANLISRSKWYPDYKWILTLLAFSFLCHAVMSLSMYPLLFKLGYLKGKFLGVYLPLMVLLAAYIAVVEFDVIAKEGKLIFELLVFASEHMLLVSGGIFFLGAVILAASYLLSKKLYAAREF